MMKDRSLVCKRNGSTESLYHGKIETLILVQQSRLYSFRSVVAVKPVCEILAAA